MKTVTATRILVGAALPRKDIETAILMPPVTAPASKTARAAEYEFFLPRNKAMVVQIPAMPTAMVMNTEIW
ncbi:MAG: hypothetical protein IMZ50_14135 [Candidatus Atribacteria bacterium]|nr:hypothetical protein [Candidatus Atribacteria bacterium]